MKHTTITDHKLVKLFDALAIVMTLPDDSDAIDSNWMNLKQHTSIDISGYKFEEARMKVVGELKRQITEIIIDYHRSKNGNYYVEAEYEFKGDRYNYPDRKNYQQRFFVAIDDQDCIKLIGAAFDLRNTYIDTFRDQILPLCLKHGLGWIPLSGDN